MRLYQMKYLIDINYIDSDTKYCTVLWVQLIVIVFINL